jgi:hypothetical protein
MHAEEAIATHESGTFKTEEKTFGSSTVITRDVNDTPRVPNDLGHMQAFGHAHKFKLIRVYVLTLPREKVYV